MVSDVSCAEWYAGRSILVTGATGFMGKVLIEKVLRSLPLVKAIYILVRVKKGKDTKTRLLELLNTQIFDQLKEEAPEQLNKIIAFNGDVLQPGLGLSAADLHELQTNVTTVFHFAAAVRFDLNLKDATRINVGGTKNVLAVAKTFHKIDVFVHISTAFCHCELEKTEEIAYAPLHPPEEILSMVEWMSEDVIKKLEPELIHPHPNTYSYTKNLAEDLVNRSHSVDFPVCVARPSIVTAAVKEPLPGWVESLNGPTGLAVACGKGIIRSVLLDESVKFQFVPVDIAANACILAAWKTAITKSNSPSVYNLSASSDIDWTWSVPMSTSRKLIDVYPFESMLWYPNGVLTANPLYHRFNIKLFHDIPAYIIDALCVLFRQKPFLVNVQSRILEGTKVLHYYTTKEFVFTNDRVRQLDAELSTRDREVFPIRMVDLNAGTYYRNLLIGIKLFILKEDLTNLPKARKLIKRLYYLDRSIKCAFYVLCVYLLYQYVLIFFDAILPTSGVVSNSEVPTVVPIRN